MKQPELGHRIAELRGQQGLTQSDLAERCNVGLRTIQRIESGETSPRSYTAKVILEALGCDLKSLDKHEGWFKRAFGFLKELFNLKTNTMKKLSVLTLFAAALFAGVFFVNTNLSAQSKKIKATTESLTGVWQQVMLTPKTGEVSFYVPFLKIFNSDGTYIHMQIMDDKPAFYNASGKWKVTSENTFREYVELMYGQGLRGHTEQQTFRLEKTANGLFMHSKFHTLGVDMADIHEVWKKCDFSEWGNVLNSSAMSDKEVKGDQGTKK